MSREIQVSTLVTDQFSVFEVDGITKVSGLEDPADFSVVIWKDGAVQAAYSYTIAEIGSSGEYKFTFTPNAAGYWQAEVTATAYDEIWFGQYEVTELRDLVQRSAGLSHDNVVMDNTEFDDDKQLKTSRTRLMASATDVDNATPGGTIGGGDPTPLAEYEHSTTWEGRNKPEIIKKKRVPNS
jgi:hypothetical protein